MDKHTNTPVTQECLENMYFVFRRVTYMLRDGNESKYPLPPKLAAVFRNVEIMEEVKQNMADLQKENIALENKVEFLKTRLSRMEEALDGINKTLLLLVDGSSEVKETPPVEVAPKPIQAQDITVGGTSLPDLAFSGKETVEQELEQLQVVQDITTDVQSYNPTNLDINVSSPSIDISKLEEDLNLTVSAVDSGTLNMSSLEALNESVNAILGGISNE